MFSSLQLHPTVGTSNLEVTESLRLSKNLKDTLSL